MPDRLVVITAQEESLRDENLKGTSVFDGNKLLGLVLYVSKACNDLSGVTAEIVIGIR